MPSENLSLKIGHWKLKISLLQYSSAREGPNFHGQAATQGSTVNQTAVHHFTVVEGFRGADQSDQNSECVRFRAARRITLGERVPTLHRLHRAFLQPHLHLAIDVRFTCFYPMYASG